MADLIASDVISVVSWSRESLRAASCEFGDLRAY